VSEPAPAKLNLYLHVLGRRDDGYHELDSLVAFADICDRVTVTALPDAEQPVLTLSGPFGPALAGEPPESNLVVRAACALAAAVGRPPAVAISLIKALPPASGIGGGSADAAACLRALARLWRLTPDNGASRPNGEATDGPDGYASAEGADGGFREMLVGLARRLGADVPVCLAGRAAYFGGIGDRLTPVDGLPRCHVLLVNPGVPVPTPAVFRARSGPFSAPARLAGMPRDAAGLATALRERGNDLAAAAATVAPEITTVLTGLREQDTCLLARVSGSGATCFGLFAESHAAEAAGRRLAAQHPDWWVAPGRLVCDSAELAARDGGGGGSGGGGDDRDENGGRALGR